MNLVNFMKIEKKEVATHNSIKLTQKKNKLNSFTDFWNFSKNVSK